MPICNAIFTRKAAEATENFIPTIWHIMEAENIPEFFMNDFRGYYALRNAKNIWCVSEHAKEYICKYFNTNVQVIQDCLEDEMYKKNIGQKIAKHFCKNIYLYRFKNYGRRFIWQIDDLERVRVPDWGRKTSIYSHLTYLTL